MANEKATSPPGKLVEFVKLIPDGRPPKRADRTAAGHIPGRAMRYCDALTTAAGYGYWIFPAMDMQLMWDGEQVFWSYGEAPCWLPLSSTSSGAVQYPGFEDRFDGNAPEDLVGFSPPFLTSLPEQGSVQIWTGLIARTKPGWSLQVREPVNLQGITGAKAWEGIIETDQWFGPIFTILRLTKTDFPVRLRAQVPFLQVQPIPQISYRNDQLNDFNVLGIDDMSEKDWSDLTNVLNPEAGTKTNAGNYAVNVRKRRTCPQHAALVSSAIEN